MQMFFTCHWVSWQLCHTFVYQIPFPGPEENSFWGWRPKPDAKFIQVKESSKSCKPTLGSPGGAAVKNLMQEMQVGSPSQENPPE